jgi:tetratricopeptide (TPR) repeat protein
LKKDLQSALERHRRLMTINNSKKASSDEIQASLEQIRRLQFQMEQWEETLETEQELHETYYESPQDMAKSHNRLGILYQRLQQYADSQHHFETSLKLFQVIHTDMFHIDVGEAWNSLAGLAAEQAELGQAMVYLGNAEPHFRHAGQHMFRDLDDSIPPHPELRKCLENRGHILRVMNQHREALVLYREIESVLLGGEPDQNLKLDLADCLLTIGERGEAHDIYRSVLQNIENPESLTAASIYHQLGLCHATRENAREALESLTMAYRLRKRLLGDSHALVGKTLNTMGAVHATLNNPRAALAHFREALTICRIHTTEEKDEDDLEIQHILKNISIVQRDMEKTTL